ncbi:hypothetical protein F8388_011872 [Cannabis sativa]|uniref:Jacalin-type lectin domain-containing protein n=1 Tax=Cannabis sativa TaxID=3483 RepID=A0A7J6GFC2_CANSA|nr:hypothetical protein F8388_011872 [Cannabis sativa]
MEGVISLGAYGSSTGGDPWSYKLSCGLKEIIIYEDRNIKSISFKDASGFISGTFGGNNPDPLDKGQERKIVLNWPVEYLISISGTHGKFNDIPDDVILSLSFQTNLKTYGPFGTTTGRGEPFTAPIGGEDSLVVGFFGRSGYYLDALGIYVKPQANISFGEWGGPGGDPFGFTVGRSWIKQITVYQDSSNIKSLSFKDGNDNEYGPFGGNNPNNVGLPTTIEFERGSAEYLTSISGTYGKYLNLTVITSISFITNLKTYGPFGGETGTPFSLPIQGGVVVGFHGKSGDFVDSIGIYVKPVGRLNKPLVALDESHAHESNKVIRLNRDGSAIPRPKLFCGTIKRDYGHIILISI